MGKWYKDFKWKDLNPVHLVEDHIIKPANKAAGWEKPGDDVFGVNTGESGQIGYEFNTPIIEPQAEQRMLTTAYNENGGADMFGSNTAYNEEPQQDKSWLERNSDWLIPAVTSLITTGAGIYYNNKQQDKQNDFNAEQAQINRDYQTEMANTAHQREMADLIATGINPVNTATGGGGANTPGGSAATGVNPAYMDHSSMANTALSLAETMKYITENKYISKEKKATIANTTADTLKKNAETGSVKATTDETKANTNKIKAETENIEETKKIIKKQFDLMTSQEESMALDILQKYRDADTAGEKQKLEAWFYSTWWGKAFQTVGLTLDQVANVIPFAAGATKKGSTININGGNTVNY